MIVPTLTINIKQTRRSKFLFKFIILAGNVGLLSLETACKLVNKSIENGAFRYKINKGKWIKVTDYHLEVE